MKERAPDGPGAPLANHRWALGSLLRDANRHAEAARCYEAVLADERSGMYDRKVAEQGLAYCALAAGSLSEARRHAEEAVRLAHGMGDDNLLPALGALIDVCLAQADHPAARRAADRALEAARRLKSDYSLYFALRDAAKVALAEKDAARARTLLAEAQPLAEALDRSRGLTTFRDETTWLFAEADALTPEAS